MAINRSKKNDPRFWKRWRASGAVGGYPATTEDQAAAALLQYLDLTADAGAGSAKVEAVFELAPGVYGVVDRYEGQREYDTYFDLNRCSITEEGQQGQPQRGGLKKKGLGCLGYGPCHGGFDFLLNHHLKDKLVLKGGSTWHNAPVPIKTFGAEVRA